MDKTTEYILEVARCGGIAGAARNLHITSSALSKFIIQKEKELGLSIFDRTGNKFILTYPGERYVEMLSEIRKRQQEMDAEMRRLADLYTGRLRLGFQMSLAGYITRKIVPAMQDQYPDIRLYLKEASGRELERLVQNDQLDATLMIMEEEPDGLCCEKICSCPVVLAAAKDIPLKARAMTKEGFSRPWLPDEAILSEKPVLDEEAHSLRKYAGYLVNAHPEFLKDEITISNARSGLMCVAQDLGIIFLPEILVHAMGFTEEVDLYSFGTAEQYSCLSVLYHPKSAVKAEIQELICRVRENIRELEMNCC